MRSVRLLPLVSLVLAAGLVLKVVVVGDQLLTSISAGAVVPVAHASEGNDVGHTNAADSTPHGGGKNAAKQVSACPLPPPEPSGPTFSAAELAALQQLAQRRDELTQREDALQRRETLLQAAEARIDEKVAGLKQLQTTLDGLIRQHDAEQDSKLKSLVKIYETMKPAQAARIFEQLELDTLLPVVEKMNERKLAAILASLDPAKAKEVTVELKKLRELAPSPPSGT